MKHILTITIIIILTGCSAAYPGITLHHPETGEIVECNKDTIPYWGEYASEYQTKSCAQEYEEKGYVAVK